MRIQLYANEEGVVVFGKNELKGVLTVALGRDTNHNKLSY